MPSRKSRPEPRSSRIADAYAPASRLLIVQDMLGVAGGVTFAELMERLEVDRKTIWRYLRALENAGVALYAETVGRTKRWRLASARKESIQLTTSQMVSLFLTRRVLDFLRGTGFREDLDDVFERLEASLRRRDAIEARNLDRKIFDLNEEAYVYDGRGEDVGELVTALLREERLVVRFATVGKGRTRFEVDPYTLAIYKKGLYLIAYSHHHRELRTFALDGFRSIDWKRGDRFEYPAKYSPAERFEESFGIVTSDAPPTLVRIRFDAVVARAARRRRWHASRRFKKLADGRLEMTMRVTMEPSFEVRNWILRWGRHVEVMEPASLRAEIAEEAAAMVERYREPLGVVAAE